VFLDDVFRTTMPMPSRSEMLRAYSARVLASFGHARLFLHLDATEAKGETASLKQVHSCMHSDYKGGSTVKWLAACCPIGTPWYTSVSDGYPGAVSDPAQTKHSGIIERNVPKGAAACVDKGFTIENHCAPLGVQVIRPVKKKTGQKQQSEVETNLTEKVGNSRIVIEQANGLFKMTNRYFNSKIPINQMDLVSLLFRNGFLFQNFRVGFVIGNQSGSKGSGRPCKGAVRWGGATDSGLIDVRGMPSVWATNSELRRHAELTSANPLLLATEVSELILSGCTHDMKGWRKF
jgi:hypothetical protein